MTISIPVDFQVTSNLDDELNDAAAAGKKVTQSIGSGISKELDQSAASARKFAISADGAASGADTLASGSSQAAGGLGDLGGALSLLPGPLGGLGAGMELAAPAIMGVTGAADLVNLALDKMKLGTLAASVATKAKTAVDIASTVATNALALATRGLGLAIRFATGPVGLILLGLTALAAGITFAWKNSETFRAIVTGAFEAVKKVAETVFNAVLGAIQGVFNWAKDNWPLLLAIITGPIGLAVLFITKNFSRIQEIVSGVWSAIKDGVGAAWEGIKNAVVAGIDNVVKPILAIPQAILGLQVKMLNAGKDLVGALFDGIKAGASAVGGFVSDITDQLKDAINNLLDLPLDIKVPGFIPGIGGNVITLIPKFAAGTDFAPGGLALVGEQGPELVNLPRGSKVSTAAETREALGSPVFNIALPTGDPEAAAMSVWNKWASAGRF